MATQRATEPVALPVEAPGEINVYTMRVFRGNAEGGDLVDYRLAVPEGQVVLDVIHRGPGLADQAAPLAAEMRGRRKRHAQWIVQHGEDMPEIKNWKWGTAR